MSSFKVLLIFSKGWSSPGVLQILVGCCSLWTPSVRGWNGVNIYTQTGEMRLICDALTAGCGNGSKESCLLDSRDLFQWIKVSFCQETIDKWIIWRHCRWVASVLSCLSLSLWYKMFPSVEWEEFQPPSGTTQQSQVENSWWPAGGLLGL